MPNKAVDHLEKSLGISFGKGQRLTMDAIWLTGKKLSYIFFFFKGS